jgi:hypothetical protein
MKLFWRAYFLLFFVIVLSNALQLLNKNSVIGVYYNTAIIFSNWFIIPYFLNILCALINCIVCLFIFGYAFDVPGISRAPQWLFYVRILIDCIGHSYDLKTIQAGFYQGKLSGFLTLAALILPILPSYLAHWRMTFNRK